MVDRSKFFELDDVSIFDLQLDPFNPRIRHGVDQNDCIERISSERESFLKLMRDIATNGLSPQHILLSKSSEGKLIVRDGNRRITALKLLNSPDSALPDEALRNLVARIAGAATTQIVNKLSCLVCDDEATIVDYLRRLHTGQNGGIGQVDWDALLIALFNAHAGIPDQNRRAAQLILWMEEHGKHVGNDFPVTTLTRLLSVETLIILGFSVEADQLVPSLPKDKAYALAARVIDDIATGVINVTRGGGAGSVFSPDAAMDYVRGVREELAPSAAATSSADSAASNSEQGASTGSVSPSGSSGQATGEGAGVNDDCNSPGGATYDGQSADDGAQSAPAQPASSATGSGATVKPGWDRPCLFGRRKNSRADLPIPADRRKALTIVSELRVLNPFDTPMAVTMLLRALIELSDKEFRKTTQLRDLGALHKNIGSSADRMLSDGLLTSAEHHIVLSYSRSEESFNHVRAIQKYIHDDIYHPNGQSLNTIWDSIGCFVKACWVGVTRAGT